MICAIVLLVANFLLTAKTVLDLERLQSCQRETVSCQALLIECVGKKPEGTDKLLRLMNAGSVHASAVLSSSVNKAAKWFW